MGFYFKSLPPLFLWEGFALWLAMFVAGFTPVGVIYYCFSPFSDVVPLEMQLVNSNQVYSFVNGCMSFINAFLTPPYSSLNCSDLVVSMPLSPATFLVHHTKRWRFTLAGLCLHFVVLFSSIILVLLLLLKYYKVKFVNRPRKIRKKPHTSLLLRRTRNAQNLKLTPMSKGRRGRGLNQSLLQITQRLQHLLSNLQIKLNRYITRLG